MWFLRKTPNYYKVLKMLISQRENKIATLVLRPQCRSPLASVKSHGGASSPTPSTALSSSEKLSASSTSSATTSPASPWYYYYYVLDPTYLPSTKTLTLISLSLVVAWSQHDANDQSERRTGALGSGHPPVG